LIMLKKRWRKNTKKNPSDKKSTPQSFNFLCGGPLIFIKNTQEDEQSF